MDQRNVKIKIIFFLTELVGSVLYTIDHLMTKRAAFKKVVMKGKYLMRMEHAKCVLIMKDQKQNINVVETNVTFGKRFFLMAHAKDVMIT